MLYFKCLILSFGLEYKGKHICVRSNLIIPCCMKLLCGINKIRKRFTKIMIVSGELPFFYILHLYIIHILKNTIDKKSITMKKHIILLITLSYLVISCAEKTNKNSEFLKKYDKIRLLSYKNHRDVYTSKYELKIENDTIIIPNVAIVDNVVLDKYYAEKITEVLLSTEEECIMADCYNPRHILLFYKQNKVADFYEFCAECGGSVASKNISFPEICSGKGDRIIEIFKEMKLKNNGEETENYKYF